MHTNVVGIIYSGVDVTINKIPEGQLCQVFDPIMMYAEKTVNIVDDHMQANTSCVAPAHVYIEGTRGKRFLCDYHYGLEWCGTCDRTPHLWDDIASYVIDNREEIKNTFDFSNNTDFTLNKKCWCGAEAFVLLNNKENNNMLYYCNFHYRKTYYRYLSNGKKIEEIYNIFDERKRMTDSIIEEISKIRRYFYI